jgi:trans-aconitate 2-methyltransferase
MAEPAPESGTTASAWDPGQYERFREERAQPFRDLAALVEREPAMRVADLGCGTGELTAWLHEQLGAAETVGVDASETMLARAAEHRADGLHFEQTDVREWAPAAAPDLIFSNAALQWVDRHEELWPRLAGRLAPGGQIAVQMPVNDDHPSHTVARELATEPPYAEAMKGYERVFPVLAPERYAELLWELGFERRLVRVHVYEHIHDSVDAVVEWMKGSLLTPYRERLTPQLYERLLAEYTRRLRAGVDDRRPYFLSFKRMLVWARLPAGGRARGANAD